jgi:hypothetical protein
MVNIVVRNVDFLKIKNAFFFNRSKARKLSCIGVFSLISFLITACATNHSSSSVEDIKQSNNFTAISPEEFDQYRDNQQQWLSGLEEGLSPQDALKQVFSYLKYSFQYKENGKVFQYIQGQYPITGMEFGLLFEDGRLTSLLLNKAVWDFSWYRYNYARVRGHLFQYWLPNGLHEGVSLIKQNNRLGDNYDDVNSDVYQQQDVNDSGGADDTSEAIITTLFFAPFLPIALAAMPFVSKEEIAEESNKIVKSFSEQLRELASKIELGETTDNELIQLLGPPAYKSGTSLTYKNPNIKFGIANGILIWSESWSAKGHQ